MLKSKDSHQWEVILIYLRTRNSTIHYLLSRKQPADNPEKLIIVWCFIRFDREVRLSRENLTLTAVETIGGPDYQIVQSLLDPPPDEGDILLVEGDCPLPPLRIPANPGKLIHEARELSEEMLGQLPVTLYRPVKVLRTDWKLQEENPVIGLSRLFGSVGQPGPEIVAAGATTVIYNYGFLSDWGDARIIAFEEFRGEVPYRIILQITDSYRGY